MQLTLDPALMNNVEFSIYKIESGEWCCEASSLPFLGEIEGRASDPEAALVMCRNNLKSAFEYFNRA